MDLAEIQSRELFLLSLEIRLFWVAAGLYLLSFLLYLRYALSLGKGAERVARVTLHLGAALHTGLILLRAWEGGRPPYQTLYEALSWFAWSAVMVYIYVERRLRASFPALFMLPIAIGACLYALLGPRLDPSIKPLPPSLQSNWYIFHVATAFASYAIFIVSFAVEASYLVLNPRIKKGKLQGYGLNRSNIGGFHRMAHRLVLFGYPLLTFGLFSGAMWANQAWGRYWGWDPKETWSLLTWMVYSLYLHARVTPKWSEGRASAVNIIGFVAMMMTFLGVNWLTKLFGVFSLHVYPV